MERKWEAEELHRPKRNKKKGERDYADKALALLKLLMNLWRALISALDTEIKSLKEVPAKGPPPQLAKGWAVTEEVLETLQLLIVTYPAIVRQKSVPDNRQRPYLIVMKSFTKKSVVR